ncbi:MAG TPA: hypothetical protein VIE63_10110 [Ramlibacter sp.]
MGTPVLRRIFTTTLVIVSLLFAQFALAQFVCVEGQAKPAQAEPMKMPPGMPCGGMEHQEDTRTPLCHQHCADAPQSFDPVKVPTVSLPAIVQVLVVPPRVDASWRDAIASGTDREAQPPPAPVFLSTRRLRV